MWNGWGCGSGGSILWGQKHPILRVVWWVWGVLLLDTIHGIGFAYFCL
jgi:hypothetical protein